MTFSLGSGFGAPSGALSATGVGAAALDAGLLGASRAGAFAEAPSPIIGAGLELKYWLSFGSFRRECSR